MKNQRLTPDNKFKVEYFLLPFNVNDLALQISLEGYFTKTMLLDDRIIDRQTKIIDFGVIWMQENEEDYTPSESEDYLQELVPSEVDTTSVSLPEQ